MSGQAVPDISDRHALVTGGSRGIGRAIALRLAYSGHPVTLTYATSADSAAETVAIIEQAGGTAHAVQADIRDRGQIEDLYEKSTEKFGPVLVLVNNAGVSHDGLAMRLRDEQWDATIETNLSGTFACTRAAIPAMLKARWGRVVTIASVVGMRGNAGQVAYASSKAGLIGMTLSLARELGRKQITVNAVAPGLIETDMTASISDEFLANVPASRAGSADEVAAAVSFLVSDDAAYINGVTLPVDGGLNA